MPCLVLTSIHFNALLEGRKTVEGRPRDGTNGCRVKRVGEISAGDILEFRAGQGCARQDSYHLQAGKCIYTEVVQVECFQTWYQMLQYYGMPACLPDVASKNLMDGAEFYRSISPNYADAESGAGVLGIRVRVVCPYPTLQSALIVPIRKRHRDTTEEDVRTLRSAVQRTTTIRKLANPSQLDVGVVTDDALKLPSDTCLDKGDLILRILDVHGKEYTWNKPPRHPACWDKLKVWSRRAEHTRNPPTS